MKARNRMRASYVQTLVYHDGPRLALLQNRKGSPVLALAIEDDLPLDDFDEPFLAKPTSERLLHAYLDQRVDLHYVMSEARGGEPYIFDWALSDKEVMMIPAETAVQDVKGLLPAPGFFARNHTEPYLNGDASVLVARSYRIDGRWSAKDFSRFYAKLDDLYSLFSYLEEIRDATSPLGQHLAQAIMSRPWQRGGSYLAFFRDIASEARDEYPLRVSKIKYASPGEIEVKGVDTSLRQIDALVRVFQAKHGDLAETHKELRSILERDGVLGTDDRDFSNPATTRMANMRAFSLLQGMGIGDADTIKKASGRQAVLFSKIALAVYRRGEELYKFHAEGRMKLPA